MKLIVGARKSPLSQKQIQEALTELNMYHPDVIFQPLLVETTGDTDLKTSLRLLEKTNFFTKEIDELLLSGQCHLAIHSAKDLPDPLPEGLSIVAITKGVDPSDSLVFRDGEGLSTLPQGAIIATSSLKREQVVKNLRQDFVFQDIRGTIGERLANLDNRKVDGVVIAEAALIRLGLTQRTRLKLEGETTPLQGKLAIVARQNDASMKMLFSCLDTRKGLRSLYLGIDPPFSRFEDRRLIHQPIIAIEPKSLNTPDICEGFQSLPLYTHLIFTSKQAVKLFFKALPFYQIPLVFLTQKTFVAVGKATKKAIEEQGIKVAITAEDECAEGLIQKLQNLNPKTTFFFWPHSSQARPIISHFLKKNNYRFNECHLYHTSPRASFSAPCTSLYDEIIFTSPSTVEAFFHFFPNFRENKIFTSIGPITQSSLAKYI